MRLILRTGSNMTGSNMIIRTRVLTFRHHQRRLTLFNCITSCTDIKTNIFTLFCRDHVIYTQNRNTDNGKPFMTSKPLKPSATRPYPSSSNCTRLGTSAFKFGTSKYKYQNPCVPFNFNLFSGYRQLNSTLYMYLYQ